MYHDVRPTCCIGVQVRTCKRRLIRTRGIFGHILARVIMSHKAVSTDVFLDVKTTPLNKSASTYTAEMYASAAVAFTRFYTAGGDL